MIRGRVIGEVWGARKAPGLDGRRLVVVTDGASDRVVVAIDTLGARIGEDVLCALGSGGRNVLAPGPDNRAILCDAAIALLVDGGPGGPGDAGEEGAG
ncbi:MAG: ethanolamine utilization protein EutN [Myxococcales bacterium]|nr:ethanolamine utilization protein EutN [Myxococcales bacterium]